MLILREIEELDYRDIAAVTQVPIGTVMSRLARARAALEGALVDEHRGGTRCRALRPNAACRRISTASSTRSAAAAFESHLETCARVPSGSRGSQGDARGAARASCPTSVRRRRLRARIAAALDQETRRRKDAVAGDIRRLHATFLGAACSRASGRRMLAAALAFFLIAPPHSSRALLDDLVNAHVRSLLPAHLVDVESTDRHTVKPWFAGHVDVSPAVYDFTAAGLSPVGGRADYFEHQRAAALVYQHGAHIINVFSWAGEGALPADNHRNGYHLAFWEAGESALLRGIGHRLGRAAGLVSSASAPPRAQAGPTVEPME